jgi:predicted ArsR family transcriptional regulator
MPDPAKAIKVSRAQSYRDLAQQALNIVSTYKAQSERSAAAGDEQIAAEYRQLMQEARARAERYQSLADLAEKQS